MKIPIYCERLPSCPEAGRSIAVGEASRELVLKFLVGAVAVSGAVEGTGGGMEGPPGTPFASSPPPGMDVGEATAAVDGALCGGGGGGGGIDGAGGRVWESLGVICGCADSWGEDSAGVWTVGDGCADPTPI